MRITKILTVAALSLMLVTTACAQVSFDTGTYTSEDQTVTINLEVAAYAQVMWQDADGDGDVTDEDLSIDFSDDASVVEDWTLGPDADGIGGSDGDGAAAYYGVNSASSNTGDYDDNNLEYAAGKVATDSWAEGCFKSWDQVQVYVNTNTDVEMTVTPNGQLANAAGDTLPSWFTVSGYDYGGFQLAGMTYTGGNAPNATSGTDGSYFQAVGSGGYSLTGAYTAYPNEWCFPMGDNARVLDADAPTQGTITFKAVVERNGMDDVAGSYSGTIDVDFAAQ
jgi:hypothetical protein